jgi:hypothetical protein
LTKQHGDELRPAGKALGGTLGGMLLYECGKLGAGKVLEQLIEQARDLYDWIALLWGAFGEDPGKEWLANVNYRRALPLFQTAKTCFGQECNYLSLGMIYLRANPLLKEPLRPEHIKNRLLGHWGSSPGLSFLYIHLSRLIRKFDQDMIFLAGPGHGAPGVLGPVYLEGTYSEICPTSPQTIDQQVGADAFVCQPALGRLERIL